MNSFDIKLNKFIWLLLASSISCSSPDDSESVFPASPDIQELITSEGVHFGVIFLTDGEEWTTSLKSSY